MQNFKDVLWNFTQNFLPIHCTIGILRGAKILTNYHQSSNISHTQSQNLNISHLVLQLSLPHPLKLGGHLHQRGKRAGRPRETRLRVPQWIGLKELCGAVYTAVGPFRLRGRRPQRSLMERFFCGTRRNRERWLVGIYRSKIQCREMGLQQSEIARGPLLV